VFQLDWNINISAIVGLLVAVSSVCWHFVAAEEGWSDKEQMVDHSIYI
jgi:predicted membrane channel-forming protein YqfA (hemolysin III family)